jgi:small subunit ribosomal protein S20
VKRAVVAIASEPTEATAVVASAISSLDRAATKGIIHKNNAARRKSRLAKRLNAAAK